MQGLKAQNPPSDFRHLAAEATTCADVKAKFAIVPCILLSISWGSLKRRSASCSVGVIVRKQASIVIFEEAHNYRFL